jgi:hypothetical protein
MSNDKKVASLIKDRWNTLSTDIVDVLDRNATYTDMYKSILNFNENYPWDYTLVDPVIFQLLRTMMSRLNPEHAKINLYARNEKSSQFRQKNQHIINWELSEMNKTMVFYNCILRGLIAGRSYVSTGWLFEPAVKIKSDITGKEEFVLRDITNRAIAKNIRFDDIMVANRNLPNIQDQPYIIEHMVVRYGEMLDDNKDKEFWKPEMLKMIKDKKMFISELENGYKLPNDSYKGVTDEEQFYRNQYVGLLKMSTKDNDVFYTFDKRGTDEILNVNTTNPYWHGHYPYLSFAPFPLDDEFYSQGMIQPLEDIAVALSSALNQFLTNARKAGNPMWIAGASASQTPDWQFVNRPDGIIRVAGDANQIRQAPIADTSQLMTNLRNELATLFEKSSSISSLYSSGVSGSSTQVNKTATGAKVIDANIDMNMQMLITLFSSQILSGIGSHFLELNAQYITEEQEIKITGDKDAGFIKIKPAEITANFDVVANPDTITKTSPVVRQAALLNLKSTMDAEKKVELDSRPIWNAIFASYPEIEEIDEDIIIDPETQAQDAIIAIERGIEPTTEWNQNHKAIKKIIQFHLLSVQDTLDDKTLVMFTKYVDELTKWIDSDKMLVTMEQQEMLQDPSANPELSVDENQIENSVLQSADPIKNMPNNIAGQEMGML